MRSKRAPSSSSPASTRCELGGGRLGSSRGRWIGYSPERLGDCHEVPLSDLRLRTRSDESVVPTGIGSGSSEGWKRAGGALPIWLVGASSSGSLSEAADSGASLPSRSCVSVRACDARTGCRRPLRPVRTGSAPADPVPPRPPPAVPSAGPRAPRVRCRPASLSRRAWPAAGIPARSRRSDQRTRAGRTARCPDPASPPGISWSSASKCAASSSSDARLSTT